MTCGSVQRRAARRRKSHRAGFSSQRRGVVHGCTEQFLDLQPSQRDAAELLYYLHSGFTHAPLSRDARGAPPAPPPRSHLLCDRRGDRPTHHGVAQPERGGARGAAARGVGSTTPSTRHSGDRCAPPAGAPPDARGRCRHDGARADAELRQPPEKIRRDAARRAAQAQAAVQAERSSWATAACARSAAAGCGAAEAAAATLPSARARSWRGRAAVPAAARAEAARARPACRRAELRARVQDYPVDDDGPRRRGAGCGRRSRRPLGRFRRPSCTFVHATQLVTRTRDRSRGRSPAGERWSTLSSTRKSKRQPLKDKHKIEKKIREHHQQRRDAKRNPHKYKKDPASNCGRSP